MQMLGGVGIGIVGLFLVTTVTATVVVSDGPVAADQVSDLKAQAAQIAKDLVLEQLQIGTYQQQYDVDVAKIQQDEAAIGSTEDKIHADISRVTRDRKRLQSEAVSAYINLDPEVNGTEALFLNQKTAPTRAEYEKVASGDIALAMDVLHTDENGLRAERATLQRQQARDQATTNQEATLANSARQTAGQLASKQSEVTGELAVAVAQQQAAEAAAAAAAVRAAQAKAAAAAAAQAKAAAAAAAARTPPTSATSTRPQASVSSTSSSTTSAPSTGASSGASSGGDPSLPPFLRCVLQAESGGNYSAVSPGGTYMGGFQFSQATWNQAAALAGMPQLINVPPNEATPAQQDDLAIALYNADGQQPWNDSCATH
jgi:peptidoglycan hydrolase CwlO-like protein